MKDKHSTARSCHVVERDDLQKVLDALSARGYRLIGPVVRDGAILYDQIASVEELPVGWTDEQAPGFYRLKKREDDRIFGFVVGPHSWKQFLHPPNIRLWKARRDGNGFHLLPEDQPAPRFAFIGVRACELRALEIQANVFLNGPYRDPIYAERSEGAFIVAINCTEAGETCFCASVQAGPKVKGPFDLALTEVREADRHYFLIESGTARGAEVLAAIPHRTATAAEQAAGEQAVADAAGQMGRTLDTEGLKDLLYRNMESSHWDRVGKRCLTCGNCTMVCPTCFCTTVEDTTDLTGDIAERWRHWDSCFTMDFSYLHGGSVRQSSGARYRQWMTHKLATWQDQFGELGCVGCGRCITWCPVGIDITEEALTLRDRESASGERAHGES